MRGAPPRPTAAAARPRPCEGPIEARFASRHMIKRGLLPLPTHQPPLTPLRRPLCRQNKVWLRLRSPSQHGPSEHRSLHGRGDGEATSIWSSCARQRAASLRPLARLARAAGQASWTVRTTAAPPRAAGQPSLKELRCENSESEDERVGVDSSGGPDRAGCATHDAQSSPRASGMGRASSHLVLCWCACGGVLRSSAHHNAEVFWSPFFACTWCSSTTSRPRASTGAKYEEQSVP